MNTYEKIDFQLNQIKSTRKEMCRNIGVSYNTIASLYQRQSENISLEVLRSISKYLNVSLDYLIFDELSITEDMDIEKTPTPEDADIVLKYMQLNDEGKEYIDTQFDYALAQKKYIKKIDSDTVSNVG